MGSVLVDGYQSDPGANSVANWERGKAEKAMKIETALDRFLQQLDADGRSSHTIAQYRRHVRLLARWTADVGYSDEIESLTHQDLARFLASPVARTRPDGGVKKASSVNCLRSTLRAFFGYLHRAGSLPTNPAHLIRRALCSPPPPVERWSTQRPKKPTWQDPIRGTR